MADNENQDFEKTFASDDGVISAGIKPIKITHSELEAYIRAGIIKPMGNGMLAVFMGQGSHTPRYFQADYSGDGYNLTALANSEGGKVASATLDNGLGISYRNGLINAAYSTQNEHPVHGISSSQSSALRARCEGLVGAKRRRGFEVNGFRFVLSIFLSVCASNCLTG